MTLLPHAVWRKHSHQEGRHLLSYQEGGILEGRATISFSAAARFLLTGHTTPHHAWIQNRANLYTSFRRLIFLLPPTLLSFAHNRCFVWICYVGYLLFPPRSMLYILNIDLHWEACLCGTHHAPTSNWVQPKGDPAGDKQKESETCKCMPLTLEFKATSGSCVPQPRSLLFPRQHWIPLSYFLLAVFGSHTSHLVPLGLEIVTAQGVLLYLLSFPYFITAAL